MVRKIEINVAHEYRQRVMAVLHSSLRPEENVVTFNATNTPTTIISVICSSLRVGTIMRVLNEQGCGTKYGLITVSSINAMMPRFEVIQQSIFFDTDMRQAAADTVAASSSSSVVNTFPSTTPSGYAAFKQVKFTTEEIYNDIVEGCTIDFNKWILAIGGCVLSCVGLAMDSSVPIVAAMLISPMMGPILAMCFAIAVKDRRLFW
jgi:Domain of unknown function (DUF389)